MSERMSVELTEPQRELLLRGLRYVRSSVALDVRDPSPEVDHQRREALRDIESLSDLLEGSTATEPSSVS